MSILTLFAIRAFGLTFGELEGDALMLVQASVAVFGSLAFLRSSFFIVSLDDKEVGIGPLALLDLIQEISDRSVNRQHAKLRSGYVATAMRSTSFKKSHVALPAFCLAMLQNVEEGEQAGLLSAVRSLELAQMSDKQKALLLGALLIGVGGPDVLSSSVEALGAEISLTDSEMSGSVEEATIELESS